MHIKIIKFLEEAPYFLKKLPGNYSNRMQEFVYYNIKFRSKYNFELNAITNMHKTPLYLNMSSCTTVQKIGSKKVNIRTQGQQNWRVTAIFTVLASGEKLQPLLIFIAKEGKDTKKKLQKLIIVESKRVFAYLQQNAWNNKNVMLKWIS